MNPYIATAKSTMINRMNTQKLIFMNNCNKVKIMIKAIAVRTILLSIMFFHLVIRISILIMP